MSPTPPEAGALIEAFARSLRAAQAVLRIAPQVDSVEPSAHPLMFRLLLRPHRVSDLAEATFCDVSVASRSVSTLVAHGLATKDSDPADRRAALVSLTDHGRHELETMMARRAVFMADVLHDWSSHDAATFTVLLERFADDLENLMTTGQTTAARPDVASKEPV